MEPQQADRRRRPVRTWREVLVVIAIFAIVIGLLVLASLPIPGDGPEVKVANDISQLNAAVATWQTTYKVRFPPPSQLFLSNNYNDYRGDSPAAPAALRSLSLSYLTQIWPRLTGNWNAANPLPKGFDWSGGLDTAGALSKMDGTGGVVLQGDQCLVFFLGGIPSRDAGDFRCTGFSSDPRDPTRAGDPRIPPQYEFMTYRLYQRPCITAAGGSATVFLSYRDAWSTAQGPRPYVYFSRGKRTNGYNSLGAAFPDTYTGPGAPAGGVSPYYSGTRDGVKQYLNPDRFQIISAGRDLSFGPGGPWDPAVAYPAGSPGADDQSNFSDRLLGVPR